MVLPVTVFVFLATAARTQVVTAYLLLDTDGLYMLLWLLLLSLRGLC